MSRSPKLPRWRRAILEPRSGMTDPCRVLLLYLAESEHMRQSGVVSVPRSTVAKDLGIAPARVSERIALARRLKFLDVVRRGRPGVTAVYQALIPPSEVREEYQASADHLVRQPGHDLVQEAYLLEGSLGTPEQYPRSSTEPESSAPHAPGPLKNDAATKARDLDDLISQTARRFVMPETEETG